MNKFTYSFEAEPDQHGDYGIYDTKADALAAAQKSYDEWKWPSVDCLIAEISVRNNDENEILEVWEMEVRPSVSGDLIHHNYTSDFQGFQS